MQPPNPWYPEKEKLESNLTTATRFLCPVLIKQCHGIFKVLFELRCEGEGDPRSSEPRQSSLTTASMIWLAVWPGFKPVTF